MSLGSVTVNNLDLAQGTPSEVECLDLFTGVAAAPEVDQVHSINMSTDLDALLGVVNDRHQPDDDALPDTGVSTELERLVAPVFIQSERYGTRASSAVTVPARGEPAMAEQSWRPDGEPDGPPRYSSQSL